MIREKEIGDRDAAFWRAEYQRVCKELAALKQGVSQLTHEVLPDGRKKLVGPWMDAPVTPAPSQVDHLAEAKATLLESGCDAEIAIAQAHATIALVETLRSIIKAYGENEPVLNVRVQGMER